VFEGSIVGEQEVISSPKEGPNGLIKENDMSSFRLRNCSEELYNVFSVFSEFMFTMGECMEDCSSNESQAMIQSPRF